jgi:hypothetical protein
MPFEAFPDIGQRHYMSLSKPPTQATMRGHVKRRKKSFGSREIRQIGAGDLQRLIAAMEAKGYEARSSATFG